MKIRFIMVQLFAALIFSSWMACGHQPADPGKQENTDSLVVEKEEIRVKTGAEVLIEEKLDRIKGKRLAFVTNHTGLVYDGVHLVDTLHALGMDIKKVFAPEHGFRGDQDAGKHIDNSKDEKTGIPLVSLYGKNKKPSPAQLEDVDIVIFDIQDVGARFYTYISTMSYVMDACAENGKQFMVLDRPNPNGWYVEGPVLEDKYKSFIGMHNIPTAHGMTIGEYAMMVNGEGWLESGKQCIPEVIKCKDYEHSMKWKDTGLKWVPPSPNLGSEYSAYLYPMLCWFEGMDVSVGRGTDNAFEILGSPWHDGYKTEIERDSVLADGRHGTFQYYGLEMEYLSFTPRSIPGKATHPKFEDEMCYGVKFMNRVDGPSLFKAGVALLRNFIDEAKNVNYKGELYRSSFQLLLGNDKIKGQIASGMTEEEIWKSWQSGLSDFKVKRRKYLLYNDYE